MFINCSRAKVFFFVVLLMVWISAPIVAGTQPPVLVFCSLLSTEEIPDDLLKKWASLSGEDYKSIERELNTLVSEKQINLLNEGKALRYSMSSKQKELVWEKINRFEKTSAINRALLVFGDILFNDLEEKRNDIFKYPELLVHACQVCDYAIDFKLYLPELISLKIHLFEYAIYVNYDHSAAKKHVEDLEKLIIKTQGVNPLLLSRFAVHKAYLIPIYEAHRAELVAKSIADIQTALNVFKGQENSKMKFRSLVIGAHSYLYQGDLKNAAVMIQAAEKQLSQIKDSKCVKHFYLMKSWYMFESSKGEEAIEAASKGIAIQSQSAPEITHFYLMNLKALGLATIGNYAEGYRWAERSYNESQTPPKQKVSDIAAEALCIMALCEKNLGRLDAAYQTIQKSIRLYYLFLEGQTHSGGQVFAHITLGDIYDAQNDFLKAREEYLIAETIHNAVRTNKQTPLISEIYVKLAINGAKIKDDFITSHYLNLHKKFFGPENAYTLKIIKYLNENNLPVP